MITTVVFAQKGDIVGAEITAKNEARRYLVLELETGQSTILHESRLAGANQAERANRFDALYPSAEFPVKVLDAYREGRHFEWRLLVSERALTEPTRLSEEEADGPGAVTALSEEVVRQAKDLHEKGTVCKGLITGRCSNGGLIVLLKNFSGELPRRSFFVKNPEALSVGDNVRVKVQEVGGTCVVFTREGIK